MDKAPAFQFYPKDWLDYKVMRMSYEAQGVYIRMLCHIWKDTTTQYSIQNDPMVLSRILGIKEKKFLKIFQEIQWPGDPIFQEKNGYLISKRLKKEKEKQDVTRKKRQQAAASRWCKSNANALQKQCFSSSSSTSSPDVLCNQSNTNEIPKKGSKKTINPDVKKFIDWWFEKFQSVFGEKYQVEGAKDGNLIKTLLQDYDFDKLVSLGESFFKSNDPFVVNSSYSIGVFKSQVNKLLVSKGKQKHSKTTRKPTKSGDGLL